MDPELQVLSNVLQSYTKLLFTRLDKITEDVQHAVTHVQTPTTPVGFKKKFEMSMHMVGMLPHYLKMLDISTLLTEELSPMLGNLGQNSPPERDRRSSNPFLTQTLARNDDAIGPNLHRDVESGSLEVIGEASSETNTKVLTEVPEIKQERRSSSLDAEEINENVQILATKNWRNEVLKLLESKSKRVDKDRNVIVEIPQDELTLGQSCIITHVATPTEFYVQTDPDFVEIVEDSLNEELNQNSHSAVNKFKSKQEARLTLGAFCFAFSPKRAKYFRIEVLDWFLNEESERVFIQLIDHGVRLKCSYKNLGNMSEFYAMFPKLATRCHLAGVLSTDPQCKTRWPQISNDFFAEICEMKEKSKFVTIYVCKEGDSYAVDLQKEDNPNGDSLGELLVRKGHAVQEHAPNAYSDDEFEDVENINELISGYDATDEARICPFTDASGGCFKGGTCRLEHAKLSEDGITTDKVYTLSEVMLATTALPAEGRTVEILITGYIDTCNFYAHILNERSENNLYNDDFQKLQEQMKSRNMVATYEPFRIYPGISELVLVQEGGDWLRGCCTGYTNDNRIEIFLFDFGTKKAKKLKDLRHMKEDFLYLPVQAVECMIHDCQEKKDVVSDASNEFFKSYMLREVFQGRIIESGKPLMLQLWGSNSVDMSLILKQWGFGEHRVDLRPAKDSPLSCY